MEMEKIGSIQDSGMEMEKIGSFGGSPLPKEILELESTKSWITRRALELLLPLLEEKAKSEFLIWFKAKIAGDFAVEKAKRKIPIDPSKEPDMDFTLSPYSDLIGFLHEQIHKLVEPSEFSTDGKPIALLWSESEKIQRNIKKLLSVSGQIQELCLLIPDLKEKLSLTAAVEEEEDEEYRFACHRRMWESLNAYKFEDLTSLSSMVFTHCAPGRMPHYAVVNSTLQILNIEVTQLTDLEWPLKVYGVIAARDSLDDLRNPLFLCPRNGAQLVTQKDPFLRLTGPTRAVVCEDPVTFEIQLKLKGRMESEDKPLMSSKLSYPGHGSAARFSTADVNNHLFNLQFHFQHLKRSVQATIVAVRAVSQPPYSFSCGLRVVSSSLPRGSTGIDYPTSTQVCPLGYESTLDEYGYLDLPRRVVSAELCGKLKITLMDSKSPELTAHVIFSPKKCNFSQATCFVGDVEMEITVGWSMLLRDDECLLSSSYIDPYEVCPPLHPSLLTFLKTGVTGASGEGNL